MLSIDWSKAPEWARYAARDQSGKWWWHSKKPQIIGGEWLPRYVNEYWTQIERAEIRCPIHWRLSLMKRPTINNRATQPAKQRGASMSKIHASPAPWSFAYTDNLEHPIILDAKGDVVCVMYEGVTTKDGRLMAAGPTLLEALKKLDAAYKRLKPSDYPESDAEKEARAAMDMALGEQANGAE